MVDIDVHFSHPIVAGRTFEVTLNNSLTGAEVIELLLENNTIPRSEIGYELAIKGGAQIRDDQTMVDADVKNDTVILILQSSKRRPAKRNNLLIIVIVLLLLVIATGIMWRLNQKDEITTDDQDVVTPGPVAAKDSPIEIVKIILCNYRDKEDTDVCISDQRKFRKNDIRFVMFDGIFQNNTPENEYVGKIGVKYIAPNGTVMGRGSSVQGYTIEKSIKFTSENTVRISSGFGSFHGGNFEAGEYEIEFWFKNSKIGETTFFKVYK